MAHLICGVDGSSRTLDVQLGRQGPYQRFARTPEGVAALALFCRTHAVTLVVIEATGGYERLPFALLWEAGLPVAIVNPRAVRDFAKGIGILEKTDRRDAAVLAWSAAVRQVAAQPPPSGEQRRWTALVTCLRQLTAWRTSQTNPRRRIEDPVVLTSIDEVVTLVTRQMRELDSKINALLAGDPLW